MKRFVSILIAVPLILGTACNRTTEEIKYYGVFLSVEENLSSLSDYEIVVIDAQFFTKQEISDFRSQGHKVFSYINIGSLEDWSPYYEEYKDLALGNYEHWDEEVWIDVSDIRWQNFITEELIPELTDKGIDGFFVDNCDVYYNYQTQDILDGLTNMMKTMVSTGKAVLINGGDCYLDAYCASGGNWNDVITGINQESVFSAILWDKDRFGKASEEDTEYFMDYIERYGKLGADIYLLEYTTDSRLKHKIDRYCAEKGYSYYISDSLELD